MYIFYTIYLQWIYWTLFFIACCSTIFASKFPKYGLCNVTTGLEPNQARSFEEHRRKHYDEYRKAKLLSANAEAVVDDDARSREEDIGSSSNATGSSSSYVEPKL
jgi:hypothetical protein